MLIERVGGDVDRRGTLTAATELSTLVTALSLAPGSVIVDDLARNFSEAQQIREMCRLLSLARSELRYSRDSRREIRGEMVFRSKNRISLRFKPNCRLSIPTKQAPVSSPSCQNKE